MNQPELLLVAGFSLIGLAAYGLLVTRHLLKLVAILQMLLKGVLLLFLAAGQISGNVELAQSFIVAVISADTLVAVLLLALIVQIFRRRGLMDSKDLAQLKG